MFESFSPQSNSEEELPLAVSPEEVLPVENTSEHSEEPAEQNDGYAEYLEAYNSLFEAQGLDELLTLVEGELTEYIFFSMGDTPYTGADLARQIHGFIQRYQDIPKDREGNIPPDHLENALASIPRLPAPPNGAYSLRDYVRRFMQEQNRSENLENQELSDFLTTSAQDALPDLQRDLADAEDPTLHPDLRYTDPKYVDFAVTLHFLGRMGKQPIFSIPELQAQLISADTDGLIIQENGQRFRGNDLAEAVQNAFDTLLSTTADEEAQGALRLDGFDALPNVYGIRDATLYNCGIDPETGSWIGGMNDISSIARVKRTLNVIAQSAN